MKINPIGYLVKTKPKQSQFVFFNAENAEFAEQKNICVTFYLTKKYNPNLLSLRSQQTRRLMKKQSQNKPNFRWPPRAIAQ